ncbi:lipopolysaccharide core heptose(II) kinase RfaY [Mucilaginibacter sp. L196]|uniref:lipopolysaccharide core heptose(II) kinase RfaY n=1 Tax=Mucilaginibacter sp. L196 TaxID=1641870 RepID=UPI00131C717B|nr:lipopolysaccharide core heptose(II) kinase RfaY [Mucilaginibacter sp. L196]
MNIGEKITGKRTYSIEKRLFTNDRPNANIYLCKDKDGNNFIAKHFYKQCPMPNVAYGKKNHFGRRRDGSRVVFDEIKLQSQSNDFLIKHLDRFKYKGKWIIILEYIQGQTLTEYIRKNKEDASKIHSAVKALAKTLSTWHKNGFAHGDPHLDNSIITMDEANQPKVSLIDYCQLHHESFKYCKQYNCFGTDTKRRIKEDLINPQENFGRGFKQELINLQIELGYGNDFSETFDAHYLNK